MNKYRQHQGVSTAETILYFDRLRWSSARIVRLKPVHADETENWATFLEGGGTFSSNQKSKSNE